MRVNVIGLGYIGLPTATMFAESGAFVNGVDVNKHVVDIINTGKIHIEEPGLDSLTSKNVKAGRLKASSKPTKADFHIIAVPTPNNKDDFLGCDLTYVTNAARSILPIIKKGDTIIVESTISPRTMNDVIAPIFEKEGFVVGSNIYLAHCPERVLPGKILEEIVYNDRIIGGITASCTEHAAEAYGLFVKGELVMTDAKTAEMSKLMENTFRDVNIALANELAKICNHLKIDVLEVIKIANKHPRVNIHMPGPGVGGHCLAVDPYFIYSMAPSQSKIIKLARDTNKSMPDFVTENIVKLLSKSNGTVGCLGVTYKPNVDDTRESPALEIIESLKQAGYKTLICDPHATGKNTLPINEVVDESDIIVILTGHNEFIDYDFKDKTVFDTSGTVNGSNIINYGNLYKYINTP